MRTPGLWMIAAGWLLLGSMVWWAIDGQMEPPTTHIAGDLPAVRIERGLTGHYSVRGRINGHPVLFMVDTGASHVSIPQEVARRIGLDSHRAQRSRTANGDIVTYAVRLDSVSVDGLEARNVSGSILPNLDGEAVLLGMSFLSRFSVSMQGNEMVLQAR